MRLPKKVSSLTAPDCRFTQSHRQLVPVDWVVGAPGGPNGGWYTPESHPIFNVFFFHCELHPFWVKPPCKVKHQNFNFQLLFNICVVLSNIVYWKTRMPCSIGGWNHQTTVVLYSVPSIFWGAWTSRGSTKPLVTLRQKDQLPDTWDEHSLHSFARELSKVCALQTI